jgi:two-component system sensor histidine kinase KdpD
MQTSPNPWKFWARTALAYLLTVLATVLTTLALNALRQGISPTIISLLYLLPVGLAAALWGIGPAAVAALLSFLALNYYFIPPYYSLTVHQTEDLLGLFVFLGVSILISQLVGRVRHSLLQATAREHDAVRLYELSGHLVGLHDEQAIARAVAGQALIAFQAKCVDVVIEQQPDVQPVHVRLSEETGAVDSDDTKVFERVILVPLQSGKGLLGELRVWRGDNLISPTEERLLQTFASQAVLALERARLTRTETRTRVLEESDRFKSSLLSSVSHELRTPLATIKASVTSLRSEEVPWDTEARADLLAAIDEETDHLNQLVGNLLNMARIEAGVLKPQRTLNSLGEIISSALNRNRQQAQNHKILVDIPEDLPLVAVDYILIEQVLINLISNSVKYSPENTTVQVIARHVDSRSLRVTVSNQGPPVPEEHLEHIFDKFFRVTAADRVTGSGLGLSICKGIVEAHGGRIWARNMPGGFAFNFTLPLTGDDKAENVQSREEA